MARREIKRLLIKPKTRLRDRPWALPALMGSVLAGGVLLGVVIGLVAVDHDPPPEQREVVYDRPPRREEMLAPPKVEEPPVVPDVRMPAARPGGPADDSMPLEAAEQPAPTGADPAAEPEVATAPSPAPPPGLPAWQRYAVPPPRTGGLPMIAVVIDDMGIDRKRSEKVMRLRPPLTLSFLTYGEDLPQQTAEAHQRGHELMLHFPMQPQAESYDPGQNVLEVGMSAEELKRRLNWGLDRFQGFVGINNHMGSRFTGDAVGMKIVMAELHRRGLLFLDSVTSPRTVGSKVAVDAGVPFVERNVFLDNEEKVAAVQAQLARLEAHARKYGSAIAIGHPRDATLAALSSWLPTLEKRGFVLVPVTTILKAKGVQG